MTTGDTIALISLGFTVVTTVCVLFLAYAALAQTARPNIVVRMRLPDILRCSTGSPQEFEFDVVNVGHWYGSPIAVDVTVYCNFALEFELYELRYGSVQEHVNADVKLGVGGMQYLRAKGMKVSRYEGRESILVLGTTPKAPGRYRILVTAYSANDASVSREFTLTCVNPV